MKKFYEKDLETIIFENRKDVHDFGFIVFGSKAFRQYKLPSGRKIDIVTWDTNLDETEVSIIEIKKNSISGRDGLVQAYEYAAELTDVLFKGGIINTIYLKIVLLGYEVADLSVCKFFSFLPDVYTFKQGIKYEFTQVTEGGTILHKHDAVNGMINRLFDYNDRDNGWIPY